MSSCAELDSSGRRWHQKFAADVQAQVVHAVEKLGQVGVKPGGQNFVNAAVFEFGAQFAGAAVGFASLVVADQAQVADHLVQAGKEFNDRSLACCRFAKPR